MESQIWAKVEDKWAYIFMLTDQEVYRMKVTGLMLSRKVKGILEALQQGQEPQDVGAKSVEHLSLQSIGKVEVNPDNTHLTLYEANGTGTSLAFSPPDDNATEIVQAVLARTGRAYEPQKQEITAFEAILGPGILGLIAGGLLAACYFTARDLEAGLVVEATGRRAGLKSLMIMVSQILGTTGTLAVGGVIMALLLFMAINALKHRPEKTVWQPALA
jgi:hypothetical protein